MASLTLSIDDSLLKAARDYAHRHDTTVTNMVREYLERTVRKVDVDNVIAFLADIAKQSKIEPGWEFDRRSHSDERDEELERRRRRPPRPNEDS